MTPVKVRKSSLKNLKPGDDSFDFLSQGAMGKGPPARQSLPFRVVPAKSVRSEGDPEGRER